MKSVSEDNSVVDIQKPSNKKQPRRIIGLGIQVKRWVPWFQPTYPGMHTICGQTENFQLTEELELEIQSIK